MNGQQLIPNSYAKLKAEVLLMLNSCAQFGEGGLSFVKAYMELKIYGNIGTRFPKSLSQPPSPGELRLPGEKYGLDNYVGPKNQDGLEDYDGPDD